MINQCALPFCLRSLVGKICEKPAASLLASLEWAGNSLSAIFPLVTHHHISNSTSRSLGHTLIVAKTAYLLSIYLILFQCNAQISPARTTDCCDSTNAPAVAAQQIRFTTFLSDDIIIIIDKTRH